MSPLLTLALLVLFVVHLVAFARLGLKRREGYYAALVVTFALLSAAMAARLAWPGAIVVAEVPLHQALRMAAWPAAAVSVAWTLARVWARRR